MTTQRVIQLLLLTANHTQYDATLQIPVTSTPKPPPPPAAPGVPPPKTEYLWATCPIRQLVKLEELTLEELYNGVKDRLNGDKVRAVYGALTKPPADGSEPSDVERIYKDKDLDTFLSIAEKAYSPVCILIELHNVIPGAQTPPPDSRPHFPATHFDPVVDATFDPPASDSENERYLIANGRKKPKAWPRTDAGMEAQKAKTRKRIRRLKAHLHTLKHKQLNLIGMAAYNECIDSDEEDYWRWAKYLNPQSGADWVRVRQPAIQAKNAYDAADGTPLIKRKAARDKAKEVWGGPPQVGDYNGW